MLDTIKIANFVINFFYTTEDFRFLGWRKRYVSSGKFYWFYKEKNESKYPYISIYKSPVGEHYLWVSVSLPAFYHRGSNAVLLTEDEVKDALYLLSIYVSEKSGIIFDADTATVWNVDFAKDLFVREDSIRPMIGRLSKMDISWFEPGGYGETTCYFHSTGSGKAKKKPRTICFYGKHEDAIAKGFSATDIAATDGMLRSEFRYRDKRAFHACDNKEDAKEEFRTMMQLPVENLHFVDLMKLQNVAPRVAERFWEKVKREGRKEFVSGHLAANITFPEGYMKGMWNIARYLGVRESFLDDWNPHGGIEVALVVTAPNIFLKFICSSSLFCVYLALISLVR